MAEMFKYALQLVIKRKLRTFLTSLGIMIAVMLMTFILFGMADLRSAVIGEFSRRFVPEELYVSGSELFMFSSMRNAPSKDDSSKESVVLGDSVVKEIKEIEGVVGVEPLLSISNVEIYLEGDDTPYPFGMISASNLPGSHHTFGGFFGQQEILEKGEIFVSDFVVSFFETTKEEILGKKIVVKSPSSTSFLTTASKSMLGKEFEFTITGVTNSGNDAFLINKEDGLEILSSLGGFEDEQDYINNVGYDQVLVTTVETKTPEVEANIVEELGLYVISTETLISFLDTLTSGLTIALIIFGAVSALVASIGIINTMIMSIYEQTKEIGIIKAMGASNFQVLVIFLVQSAVIGLIGGLLGLSLTYILMRIADPFVVDLLVEEGFSNLDRFFNFQPLQASFITIGSMFIGVLAGLYPAWKASNIDPIQALRHE